MEAQTIRSAHMRMSFIALAVWTVLVCVAALFFWNDQKREVVELVKNTALTALNKDLATRRWVISHGGVYVPIDAATPPSPYLFHIPERDIQTPSGSRLTLMNSSYVLRQMMSKEGLLYGDKTRITSLKPLNPNNGADEWETKALTHFIANPGETRFYELLAKKEVTTLRMMIPMITEQSCLKCHDPKENRVGEIRGGIDITLPLAPFEALGSRTLTHTFGWLTLIWLCGVAAIIAASRVIMAKALQLHAKEREKIRDYANMISLVVDLIDKRDTYTAGHSQRVAHYCAIIARAIYRDESVVTKIREAAILHDVGKIAIPDSILLKPGQLSEVEFDLIKYHLNAGYELLAKIDMYKELAEIIRHHHERYDGKGYPDGLAGEQIPPLSRIMIVADSFDAMTTNRIYKPRKSIDEALKEIERLKGSQFDPDVADVAMSVLRGVTIEHTDQLPKTTMEEERFAYYLKDQITGLNNHWALESALQTNQLSHENRFATVIALYNMPLFNQLKGWKEGDRLLHTFGEMLRSRYPHEHFYRIFGDKFIILSPAPIDISADDLLGIPPLQGSVITLTVSTLHLIEEKINSIGSLEEVLRNKYGHVP